MAGGSHHKDICHDLRYYASRATGAGRVFKISGEGRQFLSQLTKDQKGKVDDLCNILCFKNPHQSH
jgi:hypothetical protein